MRIPRIILASLLTMAMLASLTPGSPPRPHEGSSASKCCKKSDSPTAPAEKACDGGRCAMQCCRLIPAPVDAAPELQQTDEAVEIAIVQPVSFHSLIDPEAIFHPPKV